MRAFIGAKIIQAEPGPAPKGHASEGEPGYVVHYPDGYVSWSPITTFEEAYREVNTDESFLVQTADDPS